MVRVGSTLCCACAAAPRSKASGSPSTVDFQNRFTGIVTLPWSCFVVLRLFDRASCLVLLSRIVVSCVHCLVAESAAACVQATAAVEAQSLSIRQREYPERRAAVRVLQLGCQG